MSSAPEGRRLLPPPLRAIRAAFIFFTRLPVGGFPYRKTDWQWAAAHAPFVGLVLVGVSLFLTGAFHEDGLADTSDALGGGYDTERVLLILKDSRIGSFGGAALVVSIVGRAALLAQLGSSVAWAWPLVWCGARVGPIWLMAALPYVTANDAAKSRDLTRGGLPQALVASSWFILVAVALVLTGHFSFARVAVLALAVALVTALSGFRYWVSVRGITGDFLGATEQLGELAGFAVLAWTI